MGPHIVSIYSLQYLMHAVHEHLKEHPDSDLQNALYRVQLWEANPRSCPVFDANITIEDLNKKAHFHADEQK